MALIQIQFYSTSKYVQYWVIAAGAIIPLYVYVWIFFSSLLWNRIVLHSILAREKAEQKQQHWGVEKKNPIKSATTFFN